MEPQSLPDQKYAPDSLLVFPAINVGETYSLDTVLVEFELVDRSNVVVFRYRTGETAAMAIAAQAISISLAPTTASLDDLDYTLASAIAAVGSTVRYRIDFKQIATPTLTDYRLQGDLLIQPTHGKIPTC